MKAVKNAVKAWAKKVGRREAVGRLVSRGVSQRAAEQLCSGVYPSEPKAIREKLLDEMAKDGFSLAGGKAS